MMPPEIEAMIDDLTERLVDLVESGAYEAVGASLAAILQIPAWVCDDPDLARGQAVTTALAWAHANDCEAEAADPSPLFILWWPLYDEAVTQSMADALRVRAQRLREFVLLPPLAGD
jgi:hypothetical protein